MAQTFMPFGYRPIRNTKLTVNGGTSGFIDNSVSILVDGAHSGFSLLMLYAPHLLTNSNFN